MFDTGSDSFGLRFLLAALVVGLALAGFFAAVAYVRRRNPGMPFLGQSRPRQQRLNIIESMALDGRRRVVLVRRDNVEHLLLLGGAADLVIEQGIDAGHLAADPVYEDDGHYRYEAEDDDEHLERTQSRDREEYEDIYELETEPAPSQPVAPRAPVQGDESLGLRYTASWEEDGDDDNEPALRPIRKIDVPPELSDVERLPNEPPVGTIRPVTLSRSERLQPASGTSARVPAIPVSPEEAAIARELEAARRRGQGLGAPQRQLPPLPTARNEFDRALEQEMEEQLEAARRNGRPQVQQTRPVVQQPRRDEGSARSADATSSKTSLQSGLARIFGGGSNKNNGDDQ